MSRNKSECVGFFWNAVPAVFIFTIFYLFIYFVQGIPFVDDPYIAYRYAEIWAAGHGPAYNIGEYVEGYSSFLSVAILAAASFLSFDLVTFAPILNLFIGVGCIFLMSYLCTFIPFSRPRLTITVLTLLYALSYGVYHYGVSGWTDMLLGSLVLLFCIISLYRCKASGNYLTALPSLFLLNIVRAEGPVYSLILLSVLTYFVVRECKHVPKKLFATIAVFLFLTMLLFLFRYSIYKEWIPATVMAKGFATFLFKKMVLNGAYWEINRFLWVISEGFRYELPLLYTGVWIPYILLFRDKNKNFLICLVASVIAVNTLILIWAGGDFFKFNRQLIPVFPLMLILVAWGVDSILSRNRERAEKNKILVYAALALLLISWTVFFLRPVEILKKRGVKPLSFYTRQIGTFLSGINVPTVLMTDVAGILPYYAGQQVYVRDLFGLTDIHNAKYGDAFCAPAEGGICGRTDYNYSFSRSFDIFVYNAYQINERFIMFCKENPSICQNYNFFVNEEWQKAGLFVVADINHPVAKALTDKFHIASLPVNENLLNILEKYK
ncbi:hypothetical protein C4544_04750 [candidate division WS5 bacterium]|uniref:Glycosyltransferase RgtA/B/C/D-like domain-containing protein n=1 Tax=candidate division WS5 bacterium TaxID=2093353 RepID=A0A419DC40_9BACT|nr:MAG: hypothetical protein C4544_04750 [candidate division WS5 bacterium]